MTKAIQNKLSYSCKMASKYLNPEYLSFTSNPVNNNNLEFGSLSFKDLNFEDMRSKENSKANGLENLRPPSLEVYATIGNDTITNETDTRIYEDVGSLCSEFVNPGSSACEANVKFGNDTINNDGTDSNVNLSNHDCSPGPAVKLYRQILKIILSIFILCLIVTCIAGVATWKILHNTNSLEEEKTAELELENQLISLNNSLQDCCDAPKPVSPHWLSGGQRVRQSYADILNNITVSNSTVIYSGKIASYTTMSVVDRLLWLLLWEYNTIVVLCVNKFKKVKEIALSNIRPRSLSQTGDNEIVLAATTGLYVLDIQGSVQYKVGDGYMTDLDVVNKTLVTYNKKNNSITVVTFISGKWEIQTSFTANQSHSYSLNRVQITNNMIYLSSYYKDVIHSYSLSGQYSQYFGVYGTTSAGSIAGLFLCGTDTQGGILVCDFGNSRLQVLSPSGQWQVYTIQGMTFPGQVLIDCTGNMWVLYYPDGCYVIRKYSA